MTRSCWLCLHGHLEPKIFVNFIVIHSHSLSNTKATSIIIHILHSCIGRDGRAREQWVCVATMHVECTEGDDCILLGTSRGRLVRLGGSSSSKLTPTCLGWRILRSALQRGWSVKVWWTTQPVRVVSLEIACCSFQDVRVPLFEIHWKSHAMPLDLRPSQTAQPRHAVLDRDPHEAEYWEPGLVDVYSQRGLYRTCAIF